jgi:hypothetical protein
MRSYLRFAHTGEVAGVAGQSIAGLASLGGAMLVWTGLSMASAGYGDGAVAGDGRRAIGASRPAALHSPVGARRRVA